MQVWKRALCNTKLFFVFLLNSPYNNTLRLCLFWLQITFRNTDVWLCLENKFSGNYFQLTMCSEGFDLEMVWSENFHFKPFLDPCAEREREREKERERERERERAQSSDRAPVRADRTAPIAAPCTSLFLLLSIWPNLMNFFFSGFCFFCVSILRNDIIYLFGNWENERKCEQQVENVFFMVFSRTQPNTRKYFLKHFLKCNQTFENIIISRK